MTETGIWCRAVVAAFVLVGVQATAAFAQNSAAADKAFFAGKTITYIVATKPGGGYDKYARMITQYLEKHLPGVTVKINNVPGAGHLVGLNQLSVARPDGLTIGTFNTGLIYAQLLERPGMRVDLRTLSWIGKAASDPRILVVSKQSGITAIDGLRDRPSPALFATAGVGSASHNETVLLSNALGLDVKVVTGFGGGEGELAMMRGDVQGHVGSYSSLRPFVDAGNGRILLSIGGGDVLGNAVPMAIDMVGSGTGRGIVTVMQTLTQMGRLTAGPEGIPAARLAALREAYALALADTGLLATARKLRVPVDPLPGATVAERIADALNQPAEVITKMRALSTSKKK